MADGLNKVMLLGNLGADPELKVTQGGQSILRLRIATSETYLDKNNQRQERTEWHSVSVWGKRGEALAKILSKGSRIYIEGGLRTSSYEKDGEKRYKTEINAMNIILCDGRSGDTSQHASKSAPSERRKQQSSNGRGADDFADDYIEEEIPF